VKICIVVPAHWEAIMGGSQYQAQQFVEHLLATGAHEIHYLARHVSDMFRPAGYEVTRIASPRGWKRYGEFTDSSALLKLLERLAPDVIYQRVGCAYTGVAAYYARLRRKRCTWHVAHDQEVMPWSGPLTRNAPFRYIDKKLLEYGVRNADAVVTQTRQQAQYLRRHYGRNADAVIPNYHPLPKTEAAAKAGRRVVWVANLKPWKRPEAFLRLARDLGGMGDVEFVMIGGRLGKPEWCDSISREAERLRNVRYLGAQPQAVVNEVLAGADVFVNTSTQEGFANTFIQSWLRGVPVLSLSVDPDGILSEQDIGACCGTYEALRSKLTDLLADDGARRRMGEEARRYAEKTYANPDNLERLARIVMATPPAVQPAAANAGGRV
jgi:glycosyltransferase involved in cell wall biosynthesis